jgi:hypothetical protein
MKKKTENNEEKVKRGKASADPQKGFRVSLDSRHTHGVGCARTRSCIQMQHQLELWRAERKSCGQV